MAAKVAAVVAKEAGDVAKAFAMVFALFGFFALVGMFH